MSKLPTFDGEERAYCHFLIGLESSERTLTLVEWADSKRQGWYSQLIPVLRRKVELSRRIVEDSKTGLGEHKVAEIEANLIRQKLINAQTAIDTSLPWSESEIAALSAFSPADGLTALENIVPKSRSQNTNEPDGGE